MCRVNGSLLKRGPAVAVRLSFDLLALGFPSQGDFRGAEADAELSWGFWQKAFHALSS